MKTLLRSVYFTSSIAAVAITGLITVMADTRWGEPTAILLAPGLLVGAVLFPEGAHSNHSTAYLALAIMIDVVALTMLLIFAQKFLKKRRASQP
jgi:hypothetical protein